MGWGEQKGQVRKRRRGERGGPKEGEAQKAPGGEPRKWRTERGSAGTEQERFGVGHKRRESER